MCSVRTPPPLSLSVSLSHNNNNNNINNKRRKKKTKENKIRCLHLQPQLMMMILHLFHNQGCLAGFYQPYDSTYGYDGPPKPCPKGYFCPEDHICIMQCPLGSLCTNSTQSGSKCYFETDEANADGKIENDFMSKVSVKTVIIKGVLAQPNFAIAFRNIVNQSHLLQVYAKNPAKYGKYGGGQSNETVCPGPSDLVPCPQGYYCPTPSQSIVCPKGYYCPLGSNERRSCGVGHLFDGVSCYDIGQAKPDERPLLFSFFFGTLGSYFIYRSYSVIAHEFAIRLDVVKAATADVSTGTLQGMTGIFGSQVIPAVSTFPAHPPTRPSTHILVRT